MGISPISYNGRTYDPASISHDDAVMIYKAFRKGEVDLQKSQEHYLANMLTEDDWDEIEYDTDVAKKDGKSQVTDAENAESHGDQTANVAVTGATMIAMIVMAIVCDGFNQWIAGMAADIAAALGVASSMLFDNGYKDRTQANDNADSTNELIDANTGALEETMDMMSEDAELYQEQNDNMTIGMNDTAAQIADLQSQIADCLAMGDKVGAQQLQAQLQKLQQNSDFTEDEEALAETRERLEGYQEANGTAIGVKDGGAIVSEFLKEGSWLAIPATINALFYGIAAAASAATAAGAFPKLAPFFPDAVSSATAKILFGIAASLFGVAAANFGSKAKGEFECGASGREMADHVSSLDEMIVQQQAYIETTTEDYDSSDEKAGDDREKGQKAADKLAPGGSKNPDGTDKDKDKDGQDGQPSVVM